MNANEALKSYFGREAYNRRMNRPDGAGSSWTAEEEQQLGEEYNSGMKISEIAKIYGRTAGAIRARLKKQGQSNCPYIWDITIIQNVDMHSRK